MYRTALARSHRPRRFAELVGQDHVASTLRSAVESGRVAHAYLFCGPRGIGKTTAARVLAMALNCPNREGGEPCGTCESCQSIWSGRTALDVVEIDAASNRGVDDARDLRERAMYAPSDESRYKVYIVDEAHMLTREAWNALLKILEEPPPRVIFVFATTEPEKIRQTADPVMSRCQRFDFRRVSVADLIGRLREVLESEGVSADEAALLPIARRAEGGVRDALSLLDQVLSFSGDEVALEDVRRMLGLVAEEKFLELARLVIAGDRAGVFPFVQRLLDEGYDPGEFVRGLAEAWRMLLALRMDPDDAATELSESDRAAFVDMAREFSEEDLLRYLVATVEFESSGRLRRSTQPRIQLEALLLRLVSMTSYVEFAELVEAVEAGVPPSAGPSPAPPADRQTTSTASRAPADRQAVPPAGDAKEGAQPKDAGPSDGPDDTDAPPRTAVAGPQPLAAAWQETLAELRGRGGLGAEGIALTGARVARGEDGAIVVAVVSGLADDLRAFLGDRTRSGTLRRALARRLDADPSQIEFRVEATGRPERLTAAAAQRQRLDRLMEADPNLRDAVQTLDLRLKE
ncbi:MAG: DNA polymerase III subunit gamma/tau [Gemmatimonadales bacterium]|jgi:DNA polymerase-3 subunit gamma/tau